MSSDNPSEKRAFHYFSLAFLINFIFGIVAIIVLTSTVGMAIFSEIGSGGTPELAFYLMIPSLVIGAIGTLVYVYYLWHGFDAISRVLDNTSMGKLGSILLLFSIFVYPVIIPLFRFYVNPVVLMGYAFALLWIMLVLSIAGVIGLILVVIALFRIGEHYGSLMIKVGAILLIFFSLIGAIILYLGFKDLESKPPRREATILPPPPPW